MSNEDQYGYYPKTEEDLIDYLHKIEKESFGYNSSAEGLAKVTVAMFNYFASKQGMTGFQASWAGLKFLQLSRGMDAPLMIMDGSKLLFPQYDLQKEFDEWKENIKPELARLAKEKLKDGSRGHERVVAHWEELAKHE